MAARLPLKSAGVGAGVGAAFGLMMGGPTSAGIGAVAGALVAIAPDRRKLAAEKKERPPISDDEARERRALFMRGIASSKPDQVAKLARAFRQSGANVAARALAQHAVDLRAVETKTVDAATVERLAEIVALVTEAFGEDAKETKAAQANVDAAHAARTQREETTP